MSLEHEVRELIWQYVAQSPQQLKADVTGEPVYLDPSEVIAMMKAQIDGLIEAVVRIAVEVDRR